MHIALHSRLMAGIAFAGAGALAITPIAPSDLHTPALRSFAVQHTASENVLALKPVVINPVEAFGPLIIATLTDTQEIVQDAIADPFPVLRQAAAVHVEDLFALGTAVIAMNWAVGVSAFNLPLAVVDATRTALGGDPKGALEILQKAVVEPVRDTAEDVRPLLQSVVTQQTEILQNLVAAVPEAGSLLASATLNAAQEIAGATGKAVQNVLDSAAKLDPLGVYNSAVEGLVDVATVAEQVTIGDGTSVVAEKAAD